MIRPAALALLTCLAMPVLAEGDDDDHLSERDGIRVVHAWTPASGDDHAFLYLEVENGSSAEVVLVGATTPLAGEVHILAVPPSGGDAEELDGLPIPAGSEMELAPGGVFLELHGLTEPLVEGGEFEVTLTFEPIGPLDVHVEIEAEDATEHSHAGHSH